jgi:glucosamine--fructose-6-phosphate aminotransferase (isomerizing)
MEMMNPLVMVDNQVKDLGNLMRQQIRLIDEEVREAFTTDQLKAIHKIYITGDGDSFHAALSSEMVFRSIAGVSCDGVSAMSFLEYCADYLPAAHPDGTLVIGISASGGTKRVYQAVDRANQVSENIITLAVSGNVDGIIGKAADRTISVILPDKGRSPGIRTYQASLIAMMLLAIRMAEARGLKTADEAGLLREELIALGDQIDSTFEASDDLAKSIAKVIKVYPYNIFVGSGPSYGTAVFSAAKIIEAAGVFSMGQDLEEWAHVENLAYPDETPTFVIAPPGKGYWRAVELAKAAKEKGRLVIAVVNQNDQEVAAYADHVFPVIGDVREEFSPLIYHIAADLVAAYLTIELGRALFQTDRPEVRERWQAMMAAHQKKKEE